MAMKITDECIACGACVPECPTNSITEGSPYVIDPATCVECEGHFDSPQCVAVCPVDCIANDPDRKETPGSLYEKYLALTTNRNLSF